MVNYYIKKDILFVDRNIFQKGLSSTAIGLFLSLAAQPEEDYYHIHQITSQTYDLKEIKAAIDELSNKGLIERKRKRYKAVK
ncbi:hypothetical protein SAMN04487944_10271 [Gracilibacillus ureilyticus]|uniref:Uncharacterized protein n=1 Tax=Gracilibacillus ureilyticus TaxID=531814 RepID=A0A1H9MN40_9BACI|nr:hypothetical protein [Gracilibacillus ureilyticus]SER25112.1 hypothetical protein SAMN04487944_10271 [Gracilibacillus ureilyticus]